MADVALQVVSDNSGSERRISPSWTIGHLKARLEPITGVPPLSQKLSLKTSDGQVIPIEASDEENTRLSAFPLVAYAELRVSASILFATYLVPPPLSHGQAVRHGCFREYRCSTRAFPHLGVSTSSATTHPAEPCIGRRYSSTRGERELHGHVGR